MTRSTRREWLIGLVALFFAKKHRAHAASETTDCVLVCGYVTTQVCRRGHCRDEREYVCESVCLNEPPEAQA